MAEAGCSPKREGSVRHYHVLISADVLFSSRRRHKRLHGDWTSDVCSSDLHLSADEDKNPMLLRVTAWFTDTVKLATLHTRSRISLPVTGIPLPQRPPR